MYKRLLSPPTSSREDPQRAVAGVGHTVALLPEPGSYLTAVAEKVQQIEVSANSYTAGTV